MPVTSLGALAPSASITKDLWTRSTDQPWWIEYRTNEDGQVHLSELDIYADAPEAIRLNVVILEDRVESLDETEPAHTIGP